MDRIDFVLQLAKNKGKVFEDGRCLHDVVLTYIQEEKNKDDILALFHLLIEITLTAIHISRFCPLSRQALLDRNRLKETQHILNQLRRLKVSLLPVVYNVLI
jgi:hypothetical protein